VAHNASIDSKIGIKEIAKELDLPAHYLGKILQQLTKNKIIQSIKGPNGGFYLDKKSQEIKLIRVIEVIDDLDFFTNCGLGLKECSEDHPCPLHDDFKIYRDGLWGLFNSKSILDLVSKIEDGNAFIRNLPPNK
jgi:Rrf2 family protein